MFFLSLSEIFSRSTFFFSSSFESRKIRDVDRLSARENRFVHYLKDYVNERRWKFEMKLNSSCDKFLIEISGRKKVRRWIFGAWKSLKIIFERQKVDEIFLEVRLIKKALMKQKKIVFLSSRKKFSCWNWFWSIVLFCLFWKLIEALEHSFWKKRKFFFSFSKSANLSVFTKDDFLSLKSSIGKICWLKTDFVGLKAITERTICLFCWKRFDRLRKRAFRHRVDPSPRNKWLTTDAFQVNRRTFEERRSTDKFNV